MVGNGEKKLFVAAKGKSFADVGGGTNRYDGDSDKKKRPWNSKRRQ